MPVAVTLSNACANDVVMRRGTNFVSGSVTIGAPSFFRLGLGTNCSFGLCGNVVVRIGTKMRGVFGTCRDSFSQKTGHSSNCVCKPNVPHSCFTKIGLDFWFMCVVTKEKTLSTLSQRFTS